MSPTRIAYWQLPPSVRYRIGEAVGPVIAADSISDGLNSSVAAILQTSAGSYFVKALPVEHRWVWTQEREAEIAPHVETVGSGLIARITDDAWDVLIFDALDGHHADYSPDSKDLGHVARLIARIGELPCPDLSLRRAEQRLASYTSAGMLHHFQGGSLLHSDLNPANVIVSDDEARIVDWGWATRGAAWLDAAYWVSWLIAAGHTPKQAEWWAEQVPAWRMATVEGVTAFAVANARMWAASGDGSTDPWTRAIMHASEVWRRYREQEAI
ncbi:phosphotransferase family protein [Actinoplanes sp. NPDC051494]|uniref:phosphotransferase family protein n=1 Tax=Actinoplanes sp. NPDC051494 TaxID=3363907 RepID=UPI00378D3A7B